MYCETETVTLYSLNGCDSANAPSGIIATQLHELVQNTSWARALNRSR